MMMSPKHITTTIIAGTARQALLAAAALSLGLPPSPAAGGVSRSLSTRTIFRTRWISTMTFLPMAEGRRRSSRPKAPDGCEVNVVTVTDEKKTITIRARASGPGGPRPRLRRSGLQRLAQMVEETFDWFAQDDAGNVWYFGEETFDCEDAEPCDLERRIVGGRQGRRRTSAKIAEPGSSCSPTPTTATNITRNSTRALPRTRRRSPASA